MSFKINQNVNLKLIYIVIALSYLVVITPAGAVTLKSTNMSLGKWINPSDAIFIELDKQIKNEKEEIRFYINKTDVSSLFIQESPRKYSYQPGSYPLPKGESELVIYINSFRSGWKEVAKLPLNVKSTLGFKQEEYTGSVGVNIRSELNSGFSGDAIAPERQEETDMNTSINLSMNASDDDVSLSANADFVGVSHINEALQFGEKGQAASRLDLSSYQVVYNNDNHQVEVGHVSYGNNRYLVSSMASRGVVYSAKVKNHEQLDYSVALMNGKNIVGFNNILGLNNSQHQVKSATMGYELVKSRPGGLRLEVSYLDTSILPFTNFDTGEIPDAEKSSGFGLNLSGSNESGKLRGSLSYARSKYTNPEDPFLSQGLDVVDVDENTDDARHLELSYELFESEPDKTGKIYRIGLSASHEKVDPLFKSLAAFAAADKISNSISLDIGLKDIGLTVNKSTTRDNIDDIATILTTRTDSTSYGLTVPLKIILSGEQQPPSNWIPDINFSRSITHNYGVNAPPTFTADTHIPDQYNVADSVNMDWAFETINWSINHNRTDRDNRQAARDAADFKDKSTGLTFNHNVNDKFSYNLGISLSENTDKEANLTSNDVNHSVGFSWNIKERLGLTVNYSESDADDSQGIEERQNMTASVSLAWRFDITNLSSKKTPAQFSLDYLVNDGSSKNQVFGIDSTSRDWTIRAGLSLQLF